jgi:dipeptidyl aminopeptidase/acylaminoacyl peptidase/tetratricopeptide (TPR) repeat protein
MRFPTIVALIVSTVALSGPRPAPAAETRLLEPGDLYRLKDVNDPRLSPDGRSVAYTVTSLDQERDRANADVWLAPVGGGEAVRLTAGERSETHPRFSPDGKWVAFLAARPEKKDEEETSQVFLLPLSGGEATRLTEFPGGVSDLAWSPDSQRLVLVVGDSDPDPPATGPDGEKRKKPIVTRRLQFKRDTVGYLDEARSHLRIFDVAKKTSFVLTSGPFDDESPVWAPDGAHVAFVSNRTLPDADRNQDKNLYLVGAAPGEVPRPLTTWPGEDDQPSFSPDGKWIVYVQGCDPKDLWYGASGVAIVPVEGGKPRLLTPALDRNVLRPRFAPDGRSVLFLVEDAGNQHLARVPAEGGALERVVGGEREIAAFDVARDGTVVVLESSPAQPKEISALDGAGLRRVTRVNDEVLKSIRLGEVQRLRVKNHDGTPVDAFLVLPPDYKPGTKRPAILRIHGGPASQYSTGFEMEWQLLAARGYVVVAANPRGSTGYGTAFSRALWAKWGTPDFEDVMAALDQAIAQGVADPDRLGVGGWSYGGILTNYVITKSDRFKAAISGASISNYLAGYGTDHYQYEYEVELGLPWRDRDLWLKLSTPFFDVEKINAATLFVCGDKDMNVPLLNTEQMYEAVRRVGKVDTELVIYPGEWHGLRRPSFRKDRFERDLAWYDRYLMPRSTTAAGTKAEAVSKLGVALLPFPPAADAKARLDKELEDARTAYLQAPEDVEALLRLGRRTAAFGRFREALELYSRGLAAHPDDPRLLRHRGHRYITLRDYAKAEADLARAAALVKGRPDQADGDPPTGGLASATSTLQYAIHYHLGLARYLQGNYAGALAAYRDCQKVAAGNDDRRVGVLDWTYLTLRKLGRKAEAEALLPKDLDRLKITESFFYRNRLRLYKGELQPEDLLRAGGDDIGLATYGYAVACYYDFAGEPDKSRAALARVVEGRGWPAFAFAAAEAELARAKGRP